MTKLTNTEFADLSRDTEGNLINLFDIFMDLTDEQIDLLTEDDRYAYRGYMEEVEYDLESLCH